MFVTHDSGQRLVEKTGATRDQETKKGSFDCLPYDAILRVAQLYQRGAEKYGKHNWQLGISPDRCYSSMLRHGFQALAVHHNHAPELKDEDHLAAVVFNACCLMFYEEQAKRKEASKLSPPVVAPTPNETARLAGVAYEQLVEQALGLKRTVTPPTKPPLLYISGKLTNGSPNIDWSAVKQMNKVSVELIRRGFAVIMPQLTCHLQWGGSPSSVGGPEIPHEAWLRMDENIIERVDGLVRVMNGDSVGADREVKKAEELRLPVVFTGSEILNPRLISPATMVWGRRK